MRLSIDDAIALLERTPSLLDAWLRGLPENFALENEGPGTWSPFDVVGHLIHGEETDWIPRAKRILEHGEALAFEPFDRFAMFEKSKGRTLDKLLSKFAERRAESLAALRGLRLSEADLERRGRHPELGPVTMRQLLATWVAHDQGHVTQIARVIAKHYRDEVGPWRAYLRVLG